MERHALQPDAGRQQHRECLAGSSYPSLEGWGEDALRGWFHVGAEYREPLTTVYCQRTRDLMLVAFSFAEATPVAPRRIGWHWHSAADGAPRLAFWSGREWHPWTPHDPTCMARIGGTYRLVLPGLDTPTFHSWAKEALTGSWYAVSSPPPGVSCTTVLLADEADAATVRICQL